MGNIEVQEISLRHLYGISIRFIGDEPLIEIATANPIGLGPEKQSLAFL
ncbi:MAG TPA: hypothetical protein VE955_07840 [Candidatus Dormibacteraeota bacterium]|nr:hypothetical protein [Candidatus Dormibacteraeota bacterium]